MIESPVGDGHDLAFAEPTIRRQRLVGQMAIGDLIEIARVIESRVADELLVVAVFLRVRAGKSQHGGERRALQLSQRCDIYISNDGRARRELAQDVRGRLRASGPASGRCMR